MEAIQYTNCPLDIIEFARGKVSRLADESGYRIGMVSKDGQPREIQFGEWVVKDQHGGYAVYTHLEYVALRGAENERRSCGIGKDDSVED